MKIAVKILPRPEVLDVQGRAVQESLLRLGHELETCRVGRYVVLEINHQSQEAALKEATRIAERVLCQGLVENFELEVLAQ